MRSMVGTHGVNLIGSEIVMDASKIQQDLDEMAKLLEKMRENLREMVEERNTYKYELDRAIAKVAEPNGDFTIKRSDGF